MSRLSAIVIAKNEETKIGECLDSLSWVDEIVLVDNLSTDKTVEVAIKKGAKIVKDKTKGDYSHLRETGLKTAKGKWILYVDADERVTPELKKEIEKIIQNSKKSDYSYYVIPRKNIILGRQMKHGGWWPDYVKRLFAREALKGWEHKLHEEPVIEGKLGYLKQPLIHLKYDNLAAMVEKTNCWSEVEADLLLKANHPPMFWWRFPRIMFSELWLRLIVKKAFLDGVEGIIYAFYQMWSKFLTYAKLWEKQQNNA